MAGKKEMRWKVAEKKLRFLRMRENYAEFSTKISPAVERAVEERRAPSTVILDVFPKESITIGYFEDPEKCLDLDFCREAGIEVARRRNTGGAILGGKDSAFMVLSVDTREDWVPTKTLQQGFELGLTSMARAIREIFGIDALWRPLNDVEVEGRKVVASSARLENHVLTLRCVVNVAPPERRILERALRVPPEKMRDKRAKSPSERVTSLEEELGREVREEEIMDLVERTVREIFGEDLLLQELEMTPLEREYVGEFEKMFCSRDWFWGRSQRERARGVPRGAKCVEGLHKAQAGLLRTTLWVEAGRIVEVLITGDFHAKPLSVIERMERVLVGREAKIDAILDGLRGVMGSPEVELPGMAEEDFLSSFSKALASIH
jgi:lipoate-protein ligase A